MCLLEMGLAYLDSVIRSSLLWERNQACVSLLLPTWGSLSTSLASIVTDMVTNRQKSRHVGRGGLGNRKAGVACVDCFAHRNSHDLARL